MTANPFAWNFRAQFTLGFVVCFALIGYALYVQYGLFMQPCPLCILQRIAFAAMGVVFLLGALHGPKAAGGRRAWAVLATLPALAGAGIAARHVWMQSLPADQVPLCSGMDLSYMLGAFPLAEVWRKVFTGSGECAQIDWTFLGLSMPAWTLACYLLLGAGALWAGFRRTGARD